MLWDKMYNIILSHADQHSPVIKMSGNETCPYWYTKGLIEEINLKNVLYKKAKVSRLDDDCVTTVPLAVGYGALNLWVRSLDR